LSHKATQFIKGVIEQERSKDLFAEITSQDFKTLTGLKFSDEAKAVFDAGRELWKYYHNTIPQQAPPSGAGGLNASLYDIRDYFQGRNDKGRMNARSSDEKYTALISEIRNKLNLLADKIKPKIY
jgi:hypothetical protein